MRMLTLGARIWRWRHVCCLRTQHRPRAWNMHACVHVCFPPSSFEFVSEGVDTQDLDSASDGSAASQERQDHMRRKLRKDLGLVGL
jgi:hypothetical protein